MGLDWIIDDPCEAVDAPRLDTKQRAKEMWNEWVEETYNYDDFEHFWEKSEGKSDCEKCRIWEEYDAGGKGGSFMANPCSFRGKRLKYVDELPESIKSRIYDDQTPEEMIELADDLESVHEDNPNEAIEHAINWLRFWAEYDVEMIAYY